MNFDLYSNLSDSELVKNLLWEFFPEWRVQIEKLEEEEKEYSATVNSVSQVGAFTLVSEVFVDGVLHSLLGDVNAPEPELARKCANFLESLLGVNRPSINELVSVRITDYLLGYPDNWVRFRGYAKRALLLEIASRARYYSDPFGVLKSPEE